MAAVGSRTGPRAGAEALALATELQGEATCSICLELFREPVSVECGHSFCRACIARCWERPGLGAATVPRALPSPLPCPQCREPVRPSQLRPNRQLAAVATLLRRFSLPAAAPGKHGSPEAAASGAAVGCAQHGEPLKLYCQDDGRAICVVCDRAREHREHAVLPLDEAVQEAKELLESRLKVLQKELEDYEVFRSSEEKESKELLEFKNTLTRGSSGRTGEGGESGAHLGPQNGQSPPHSLFGSEERAPWTANTGPAQPPLPL
ncbi:E3 ubiquitin-protein ligase TRIM7 isoform X6 [Lepus europaeus]|uniref:E3 ubiquitin-protein ligase TRIM7 isoform X6 n=1 Tax=Lepus europaeus TaxID=9983 RepID=UPI002B4615B1|nr:E3 ubiquitin-protein ligase TRIM7 isoform X6 [Lepus europaeus]